MPRKEHHGEDFHYVVGYRPLFDPSASDIRVEVFNWEQTEYEVKDQPTFQPYEIYVEAANKVGRAPQQNLVKHKGYSGQDS